MIYLIEYIGEFGVKRPTFNRTGDRRKHAQEENSTLPESYFREHDVPRRYVCVRRVWLSDTDTGVGTWVRGQKEVIGRTHVGEQEGKATRVTTAGVTYL